MLGISRETDVSSHYTYTYSEASQRVIDELQSWLTLRCACTAPRRLGNKQHLLVTISAGDTSPPRASTGYQGYIHEINIQHSSKPCKLDSTFRADCYRCIGLDGHLMDGSVRAGSAHLVTSPSNSIALMSRRRRLICRPGRFTSKRGLRLIAAY